MKSLQKLTSAQAYVDHYYDQLKKELNSRGLQISKVGMIGLILHILGFTQTDIKQYFDTLFREAFVATADKYENLVLHSSIYGYVPGLSTPANVVGYFEIALNALPMIQTHIERNIIIENLSFVIDDIIYNLDSQYVISGSNCQIIDSSGSITNVPFNISKPRLPIINLVQYYEEEFSYSVPFYIFGSHYSKKVTLDFDENNFICDIEVLVKLSTSNEYVRYETRLVNYFTTSDEEVVFIKHLNNNEFQIDLGSGINGRHIPNSMIRIKVRITRGSFGNISNKIMTPSSGLFRVYDTEHGKSTSFTVPVRNAITAHVDYADGGTDALDSEQLRDAVLSFIRSRNFLMSETDFYELLKFYIPDFVLMFKKTHVVENVIYCFAPFRTKYQLPVRSQSISVKHYEFNPDGKCHIYRPMFIINGKEYISPFLYVIDYMMRYYKGFLVHETVSRYFSNIIREQEQEDQNIKTIPLTFHASYNQTLDNTRFLLQSYEDVNEYVFYMDIPLLGIYDVCMTPVTPTLQDHYYYNSSEGIGLVFGEVDISIKVYKNTVHIFTYNLYGFKMVDDISDLLTLKTFDGFVIEDLGFGEGDTQQNNLPFEDGSLSLELAFDENAYVLNIPVMRYDEFERDEDYYIQRFVNTFGQLSIENNRMISDDVQIRFLNTDDISADFTKVITKQEHNMRLQFPLHLSVHVVADGKKIKTMDIDTVEAENKLKYILADGLFNKYTGSQISFYRTQIVDIIHDFEWVKHCTVAVYDNLSQQIPDANIELNEQDYIINNLDKLGAIVYCPLFIWWDLDNITINLTFE